MLEKEQRPVAARETARFLCFVSDHRSLIFKTDNFAVILPIYQGFCRLTGGMTAVLAAGNWGSSGNRVKV